MTYHWLHSDGSVTPDATITVPPYTATSVINDLYFDKFSGNAFTGSGDLVVTAPVSAHSGAKSFVVFCPGTTAFPSGTWQCSGPIQMTMTGGLPSGVSSLNVPFRYVVTLGSTQKVSSWQAVQLGSGGILLPSWTPIGLSPGNSYDVHVQILNTGHGGSTTTPTLVGGTFGSTCS